MRFTGLVPTNSFHRSEERADIVKFDLDASISTITSLAQILPLTFAAVGGELSSFPVRPTSVSSTPAL
jgi:hypothetical protein